MQIHRTAAEAPRTEALWRDIVAMRCTCIGCPDCRGLCAELIELLRLPEIVLNDGPAP